MKTATDGPFGIPFVAYEEVRKACETPEELLKRRPELKDGWQPGDPLYGESDDDSM